MLKKELEELQYNIYDKLDKTMCKNIDIENKTVKKCIDKIYYQILIFDDQTWLCIQDFDLNDVLEDEEISQSMIDLGIFTEKDVKIYNNDFE